jgi:predicted ArsR family transcriptional regulator
MNLARQREMTKRLEAKVHREIRERKADTANLSERVDRLTEILERHGITEQSATAA